MRGDMKISRGRAEGDSRIGQGTFTGLVHQDSVLENRPAVATNDNFFAPGARSYWHSHEGGQVLIVKAGQGHIHNRSGESAPLHPGDVVYADPGEEHWHGAAATRFMTHLAIVQVDEEGNAATWLDHVTDEEYAAAPPTQS